MSYQRSAGLSPLPGLNIPLPRSTTASPTVGPPHDEDMDRREVSQILSEHIDDSPLKSADGLQSLSYGAKEQTLSSREPTFSSEEGLSPRQGAVDESEQGSFRSPAQMRKELCKRTFGLLNSEAVLITSVECAEAPLIDTMASVSGISVCACHETTMSFALP